MGSAGLPGIGAICIESMAIGLVECGGGINVFPTTKTIVPSLRTVSSGADGM